MADRTVKLSELGKVLEKHGQGVVRAVGRGVFVGAQYGKTRLVRATPVDQGQLRNSWKVSKVSNGGGVPDVEILNEAPHAGIVEKGARPHKVSPEGWAAIYQWVLRHRRALGHTTTYRRANGGTGTRVKAHRPKYGDVRTQTDVDPAIAAITWAIVKKIEKYGQAPTYFVRNTLPKVTEVVQYEVEMRLRNQARGDAEGGEP